MKCAPGFIPFLNLTPDLTGFFLYKKLRLRLCRSTRRCRASSTSRNGCNHLPELRLILHLRLEVRSQPEPRIDAILHSEILGLLPQNIRSDLGSLPVFGLDVSSADRTTSRLGEILQPIQSFRIKRETEIERPRKLKNLLRSDDPKAEVELRLVVLGLAFLDFVYLKDIKSARQTSEGFNLGEIYVDLGHLR